MNVFCSSCCTRFIGRYRRRRRRQRRRRRLNNCAVPSVRMSVERATTSSITASSTVVARRRRTAVRRVRSGSATGDCWSSMGRFTRTRSTAAGGTTPAETAGRQLRTTRHRCAVWHSGANVTSAGCIIPYSIRLSVAKLLGLRLAFTKLTTAAVAVLLLCDLDLSHCKFYVFFCF